MRTTRGTISNGDCARPLAHNGGNKFHRDRAACARSYGAAVVRLGEIPAGGNVADAQECITGVCDCQCLPQAGGIDLLRSKDQARGGQRNQRSGGRAASSVGGSNSRPSVELVRTDINRSHQSAAFRAGWMNVLKNRGKRKRAVRSGISPAIDGG